MHKLDNLIQEIIDFGHIVSYNQNPEDPNFQTACILFSDYLNGQLNELKEELKTQGSELEIQQATHKLNELCGLIEHNASPATSIAQWFDRLLQYCSNIHQGKTAII